MHPYWFHIGPFPVRAYSTLFVLAFLLGFGVTLYLAKVERKERYVEHLWNLAPWLFLAGVVGARFWQVFFFDWPFYRAHPWEIPAVWHGGLSIQGGVVGALVMGLWYVRRHQLNTWELMDLAAPGLVLGQSIGRAANVMNGDAFGGPTGGDFGILYPQGSLARQVYGDQPLWPAEIWEGQADVVIFALLLILKQWRLPKGWVFFIYVILYNGARFFLEMLRGDSPRFLFGWTAAQWTSVAVVVLAAGFMVYLAWRSDREAV
ncbi:prolipoprotein diacylglyceryl transferase [Kyrpidia tusciae]|uniref:Phosphatidylglycerol--prolipoprotein diacylglyceryl transferase n=1 Tax=Kyrpidia tusciae (strain DSM 2912 / NBRC 15312 / T2) TaxID=562970 RepID=D5WRA2_KYRT2|nr:prolipoprotein diacylglyceryl transferase [Kyrpidia tusciae]ADG06832.1 prolipoprotein diacylglyceryl transferase [Kyrpidia tusciae DSM 2912]